MWFVGADNNGAVCTLTTVRMAELLGRQDDRSDQRYRDWDAAWRMRVDNNIKWGKVGPGNKRQHGGDSRGKPSVFDL